MKSLLSLLFIALFTTTSAQAIVKKDLEQSAQEEIENYYSAEGEWSVVKIKELCEVDTDSNEFRLMKSKVALKNLQTEKLSRQTCLVTFVSDTYELYGINCFNN